MKKFYFMVLWFLCSLMAFGKEEWRNIKSMESDFTQEIKGEKGAIPVVYKGKFYAANNKVKWVYSAPLAKEVYLEKNEAYIYEPELKQVTLGNLKENVDFIEILKKVKSIGNNQYQTKIGDTMYYVITKDSKPYELRYTDSIDNVIVIRFENIKMNVPIDGSVFIFQPPDDVEYIDAN